MATTLTVIAPSRTPASVAILLENNGVADMAPLEISKANLLAQLRAGPLYELIHRTADLTALNFGTNATKGDFVRITNMAGGYTSAIHPPLDTVTIFFSATGLTYSIWTSGQDGGVASEMLVELRAVHSNER